MSREVDNSKRYMSHDIELLLHEIDHCIDKSTISLLRSRALLDDMDRTERRKQQRRSRRKNEDSHIDRRRGQHTDSSEQFRGNLSNLMIGDLEQYGVVGNGRQRIAETPTPIRHQKNIHMDTSLSGNILSRTPFRTPYAMQRQWPPAVDESPNDMLADLNLPPEFRSPFMGQQFTYHHHHHQSPHTLNPADAHISLRDTHREHSIMSVEPEEEDRAQVLDMSLELDSSTQSSNPYSSNEPMYTRAQVRELQDQLLVYMGQLKHQIGFWEHCELVKRRILLLLKELRIMYHRLDERKIY